MYFVCVCVRVCVCVCVCVRVCVRACVHMHTHPNVLDTVQHVWTQCVVDRVKQTHLHTDPHTGKHNAT